LGCSSSSTGWCSGWINVVRLFRKRDEAEVRSSHKKDEKEYRETDTEGQGSYGSRSLAFILDDVIQGRPQAGKYEKQKKQRNNF
jgi:hypothetical protein